MNRNKVLVILITIVIVFLVILINIIKYSSPVTLDAKYINQEILTDTVIDELLLTVELENENGVICLCSSGYGLNGLEVIYLEKQKYGYEFIERDSIALQLLTDNFKNYIKIEPIFSTRKSSIYFCVFKNPKIDSLMINGDRVDINKVTLKFNAHKIDIGFWSKVLPENSTPIIQD